jgi:pre-mRNA-splicing factor 38A
MLTYMDEFVDNFLAKERVCGTSLRKMPPGDVLEPRSTSDVEAMLDEEEEEDTRNGGDKSSSDESDVDIDGWASSDCP